MMLKRDGTTVQYQDKRCEFTAAEQAAGFMLSLQKGKPFDLCCRVWLPAKVVHDARRSASGTKTQR